MDYYHQTHLLEQYIRQALSELGNYHYANNHYNFRCNICGDSSTRTRLKRAHIILKQSDGNAFWYYKCWNGDCPAYNNAWSVENWLKNYFPNIFRAYILEDLQDNYQTHNLNTSKIISNTQVIEIKSVSIQSYLKEFQQIQENKNALHNKAIVMCKYRKIPESIWKKFYVCNTGTYHNRLIIPFYNRVNNIYYFQGRNLRNGEPKYLNYTGNKDQAIYNFYNVNKTKPVVICEGPIDSMFIENAIAILGLSISDNIEKELQKIQRYWLFDNDKPGKLQALKYLKKGEYVFNWEKFNIEYLKYNHIDLKKVKKQDINSIVMNSNVDRFYFDDLKPFFTNSYIDQDCFMDLVKYEKKWKS